MLKKYFSGLKFGMILQLAIGPMCLLVFNTAKNSGFLIAIPLIIAIALVDSFYITLAGVGVSKLLEKHVIKKAFKVIGSSVLVLFGLNIILNVFGIYLIPGLNLKPTTTNIFIQGLMLNLSNPLTIVFWGSFLPAKIIEDNLGKKDLIVFSLGLVSATLFFMMFVAILGTILSSFIPDSVSNVLNILVGILIIFFGIKIVVKKNKI